MKNKIKNELVFLQDNEPPKQVKIDELPYIFVTEFSDSSVIDFYKKFLEMQFNPKVMVIPIVISSYGGQAYSLLSMLDIIEASTKPVATIGLGKAMSCGAVLLASGTKGYRYTAPNNHIMIHEVSSMDWGKVGDLKNNVAHVNNLNNHLFRTLAKKANKSDKDFFIKALKSKGNVDWYLSSEECKKLGLIDHISVPKLVKK